MKLRHNTVIISTKEYNRLRDIKNREILKKSIILNRNEYNSEDKILIVSDNEIIEEISKRHNEAIKQINKLGKMSLMSFKKWRENFRKIAV